jgi:type II secretion system protein C
MVWSVTKWGKRMRSPLWAVNSFLLSLFIALSVFMLWSSGQKIRTQSLDGKAYTRSFDPTQKTTADIDIRTIYTNDIFGTYSMPIPKDDIAIHLAPVPIPPKPIIASHVTQKPVAFLDPLKITLVGIIAATDDTRNRAIVADTDSKQETTYRVGDVIKDAQIIRIFPRKVILIRSNGQQEVLFVNEEDAENEYEQRTRTWNNIVRATQANNYDVNTQSFVERIPSLAHLIETFDLMSVFKQGHSIGCRVGHNASASALKACGLEAGDIITHINNIPTTNTNSRLKAYNSVLGAPEDAKITVKLTRDNKQLKFAYTRTTFVEPPKTKAPATKGKAVNKPTVETPEHYQRQEEEKIKILQQRYTFAPTAEHLRQKERSDMLKTGKKSGKRRRSLSVTKTH